VQNWVENCYFSPPPWDFWVRGAAVA
jgi:hypothetical protein